MTDATPRLALRALRKRFGSVKAVAALDLALPAGSIHGILGENGAGKSTLVRLVAGALVPDGGSILIDGEPLAPGEPRAARTAGVGVVYQHFALIGALSVAENLLLGRPELPVRVLSPRRLVQDAADLARTYGLAIGDPARACGELPVGTQARIEILRALSGKPRILLLDEPTAVLTPPEIAELFDTLRRLRAEGMLVIFITHKLEEALALCDQVSVMRAGRLVTTVPARQTSAHELARLMVGAGPGGGATARARREDAGPTPSGSRDRVPPPAPARESLLVVRELEARPDGGRVALRSISFSVAEGEICGIAGVDGNGQEELAGALFGLIPRHGTVRVAGTPVPPGDVEAAQRAGMTLIPADRRRDGLAGGLSVWENAILAAPLLRTCTRFGLLDRDQARALATGITREYRVVLASIEQAVATLSGGNQQRVVIGRALALRPRVLVAANPTRGLDVTATAHVHATIARAAGDGVAVLLISTDLDELTALCDRVFALYRGRLGGPVGPGERERLGALMAGLAA